MIIVGLSLMYDESELSVTQKLINSRLKPLGINVDITLKGNGNITVTATKPFGINTRHVVIDGTGLVSTTWKLVNYVEREIQDWVDVKQY